MRRRENRELLKLIIQLVEIGNRAITSESAQSDLTLLLILFKLYSPTTGFISPSRIKANELKQKITKIEKIVFHFLLFFVFYSLFTVQSRSYLSLYTNKTCVMNM